MTGGEGKGGDTGGDGRDEEVLRAVYGLMLMCVGDVLYELLLLRW